jgi:hypothetical protein
LVEVNRSLGAAGDRVAHAVERSSMALMLAVRVSHESLDVRATRRGDAHSGLQIIPSVSIY